MIEQVNDDQEPVEIVSKAGTAYLVSADQWRSLMETADLLRSPEWAILERINRMIEEATRDPATGIGKPERLSHNLSGYWDRRITDEHRLAYQLRDDELVVVQAVPLLSTAAHGTGHDHRDGCRGAAVTASGRRPRGSPAAHPARLTDGRAQGALRRNRL